MAPDAPEYRMRHSVGMLMAWAASIAAIALAGLAVIFLQVPGDKVTRGRPAGNAILPSQSPTAAEVPQMPRFEQSNAVAPSNLSSPVATGSTSQSREPARAEGTVAQDEYIATSAAVAAAVQANSALGRPPPKQQQIATMERSGVNIRAAPSASSRVVGSAPKGARFAVTNRVGGWVEIESEAVKGWVSGHFLRPPQPGDPETNRSNSRTGSAMPP